MAEKELPGINSESQVFLEGQVKKGKARKFFLVYKGAKIRTLVVFKKGPFGPKLMAAKKEGFLGDNVCGIVTGSGQNLTFMLPGNPDVASVMNIDRFVDEAPIEQPKFRKFLTENGMKFKPEFQIVMNPAEVPGLSEEDEEEAVAPPVAPPAAATAESESAPPAAPPVPEGGMVAFEARLKQVAPQAVPVAKAGGEVGGVLMPLLKRAQAQRASGDHVGGMATLDEVERLLRAPAPAAPPPPPNADPAAKFRERLAALIPQFKQAAGTPTGDGAKLKASEAGVFARKQDFGKANTLLDEAEALLKTPAADSDWPAAKAKWQDASDTVDGQISKLQGVLKQSDDKELVEIAEFGLNAVTGNFKVPLMAAIRDIDSRGGAQPDAARKALDIVRGFREHILTSAEITAVDNNPFGVEVNIQNSLSDAFNVMEKSLQGMVVT